MNRFIKILAGMLATLLLGACSDPEPIANERFIAPEELYDTLFTNISQNPALDIVVDIDHARLGAEAGSPMPPAHVLIWSDREFDTQVVAQNPLAAIDLPFRLLAHEDPASGQAQVLASEVALLINRHGITLDESQRSRYASAFSSALEGIPADARAVASSTMADRGLVILDSPFDMSSTEQALLDAIGSQGDTVIFGTVDFQQRAAASGVDVAPVKLILFGGPGPGGKAMAKAPALGLDAFCQKLLVWQDQNGAVKVAFNDLLAQAARLDVPVSVPLRVINFRLKNTFETALE